jgi:hypothetical protein
VELLTALGPAQTWLGLKSGNDVGMKFDLLAEVLKNGIMIGSGQSNDVPGGSSGFNNAVQQAINLAVSDSSGFCIGDNLSIKLSVRVAAGSDRSSGTARLWYNDSAAILVSHLQLIVSRKPTTYERSVTPCCSMQ